MFVLSGRYRAISVASRAFVIFSLIIMLVSMPWLSQSVPTFAAPAVSQEGKKSLSFEPHGQLVQPMKDGESFINAMCRDAERLEDYSFLFETKIFKKTSTLVESGIMYFKKPNMMRLEESGEWNKGSIAVIRRDGKARARGGGLASLVTLTMSPDDKRLNAANGDPMKESDLASLARYLSKAYHHELVKSRWWHVALMNALMCSNYSTRKIPTSSLSASSSIRKRTCRFAGMIMITNRRA